MRGDKNTLPSFVALTEENFCRGESMSNNLFSLYARRNPYQRFSVDNGEIIDKSNLFNYDFIIGDGTLPNSFHGKG